MLRDPRGALQPASGMRARVRSDRSVSCCACAHNNATIMQRLGHTGNATSKACCLGISCEGPWTTSFEYSLQLSPDLTRRCTSAAIVAPNLTLCLPNAIQVGGVHIEIGRTLTVVVPREESCKVSGEVLALNMRALDAGGAAVAGGVVKHGPAVGAVGQHHVRRQQRDARLERPHVQVADALHARQLRGQHTV